MLKRLLAGLLLLSSTLALAQERVSDVIYAKINGAAFTYDVFKPKSPNGSAVIWMVSGGWFSRHEDINTDLAKGFTDRGITLYQVVHGAQPKYTIPEILVQVRRAVRMIHASAGAYGVDPNRIGIAGGSAGGHLSLMIAATGDTGNPNASDFIDRASSQVNAVGVFFPPTDFLNFGGAGQMPIDNPGLAIFLPAFGITMQTPRDKASEVAKALSPMTFITAKMPPVMLIHGDKDALVPIQQSLSLDAKLKELGVDHTLVVVPGGDHGSKTTTIENVVKLLDWFAEKLAKK